MAAATGWTLRITGSAENCAQQAQGGPTVAGAHGCFWGGNPLLQGVFALLSKAQGA